MIVITLTDCPPALRGDLTKWLQEINTGVYVGRVSARVRDKIWKRVQDSSKSGRATMVFSTNNEQRMDFRVHNSKWEPIDFDGLKLILRPSPSRIKQLSETRMGFSKASRMHKARQMSGRISKKKIETKIYIAVEVEAKGTAIKQVEPVRVCALKVIDGNIHDKFNMVLKQETDTIQPGNVVKIMHDFLEFVGDLQVVSHNVDFLYGYLRSVCERCGLPLFSNRCVDTESLARRLVDDVDDYKLKTLLKHFNIKPDSSVGGQATYKVYEKLIELQQEVKQ